MIRFICICAILLCSLKASAQYSFTDAVASNVTIDSMYVITATTTPGTISFSSVSDYAASKTVTSYATLTIKCNYNWIISVKAQSALFTGTTTGTSTDMPCSILRVKKSTSGSYITVSTTSQSLATGNKGPTSTSGNTFNIDMNVNPGFSYNGGSYNIVLVYTVSKQ